jgi:hypothetical protein
MSWPGGKPAHAVVFAVVALGSAVVLRLNDSQEGS